MADSDDVVIPWTALRARSQKNFNSNMGCSLNNFYAKSEISEVIKE